MKVTADSKYVRMILLTGVVVLITGCGGMESAKKEKVGDSPSIAEYRRVINPFPVYEDSTRRMSQPFLGGFNTPRPQFVDIDDDGDDDLFIQENTNELMYLENVGDEQGGALRWRTDRYRDLEIGEWFRFVDMDQDGVMDLITEQPYSYIRYYHNKGTASNPDFELAADTLRNADGKPIFSDRQNIPNVTDIDCDGKLDLFVGRLDGTLMRYESIGRSEEGIPRFKLVNEQFEGIEIVNQIGTLHGANTLTFADIDNDGDQDLFWGDFFEPSLLLIENTGSCGNPVLQTDPAPFPPSNPVNSSGYNAPAFADWGQDGDLDLFVGVLGGAYNANKTLAENFYYYRQGKGGGFKLQTRQFLDGIDVGNESKPAAGDIDGDGDVDLLLANKIDPRKGKTSLIYRFESKSGSDGMSLHKQKPLELPEAYHWAPALADLNGDGRDDLLLGNWKGEIAYYRNTRQGFKQVSRSYISLDRTSHSVPALGDLDDDGDLDLLVGESGGGVYYFENRGTASEPEFVRRKDRFPQVEVDSRSTPELHDIDGDGDLDLLLGSKSDGTTLYRNTGSPEKPVFKTSEMPITIGAADLSVPLFTDLDGDGVAEFLSGSEGGGLLYYAP